ncbi:MAG: HAMP domain-containing histidine kinase [Clostridia bacterium]|nr:HAMP domain-containing histidine kinase [Clostridia bacterium]
MKLNPKEKAFASKLRNFITEFISVFFIVALNGTFLVLILVHLIDKGFGKSALALFGVLYLLLSCTISACLIYVVKGRVYFNKIKVFCDVANEVAKGDFAVRAPIYFDKPKSEMDFLTVNFNKMLTEISSLENMRNNFIADVSHEIKTPLSVIQGYADLLQEKNLSPEKRAEYTHRLSLAIEALTNLVTNILKLNKIENQGIVQKEAFSLDEQIRCCILAFEEKIEEKKLQLNVELEEITITSDKSLLEIVWNNIISNAIKYTDFNGKIDVELKSENGKTIVKIRDNGCGMSKETLSRCFEKFYQGDTSHSQEGNGLGLALVKQVINLLDSEIKIDSSLQKGTQISVII